MGDDVIKIQKKFFLRYTHLHTDMHKQTQTDEGSKRSSQRFNRLAMTGDYSLI